MEMVDEAVQWARDPTEIIRLSRADQESFVQALISPPQPPPALKRAFARHKKLIRPE